MSTSSATLLHDPWLAQSVRIKRIIQEIPGVATYDLAFDDPEVAARYAYCPGQFNMLYLPGVGESAISISGDPAETYSLVHTVREAGNVTQSLARLKVGDSLGLRGPFGSAWPVDECQGADILLVAGGIGLAPLRPVIYSLMRERERYGQVTILCGARSPEGLLYPEEYAAWNERQLNVEITVDRGNDSWQGHVGVVTTLLDRLPLPRPERTWLMTCGPEVMMWHTIQSAIRRSIPREQIYLSLERNMNCALGQCGHCQYGPEFVCLNGPVFRYDRVATILKVHDL